MQVVTDQQYRPSWTTTVDDSRVTGFRGCRGEGPHHWPYSPWSLYEPMEQELLHNCEPVICLHYSYSYMLLCAICHYIITLCEHAVEQTKSCK